jgi:hypothetical protein
MRYIVVYLAGSLNESNVAFYAIVDTQGESPQVHRAILRCVDADIAIAIRNALNEGST